MKKNVKFRNNSGNTNNIYSLNYKFDSISPAGKINGTALDLIKKYNELAKEAHGSGDYIEMEVYRQYAEHYRKIVTEINERKNMRQDTVSQPAASTEVSDAAAMSENINNDALPTSNEVSSQLMEDTSGYDVSQSSKESGQELPTQAKTSVKKSFKIIEIKPQNVDNSEDVTNKNTENKVLRKTTRRKRSADLESGEADAI